ncbi:voltage-gated chloride channel family protein [Paenibacillus sp. YPG26]|uniref:voltage-gated chloride channel family protein n=1 Tax=Paenibacillus sp. YPG26 TaxID=2878915 RepID=UPI0020420C2F|nr:voltage-gated chloride channel family protein [Paenibacillus sp. YPG26]USB35084.1 voltage-gated chloride channel family protein [Paenibacillus sp. YPG26]
MQAAMIIFMLKWLGIAGAVGALSGSASALFLAGLDWATDSRMNHAWLLYLLPVGGAFMSYLYLKIGSNAGKGNNLILETIHHGKESIPLRMAPLVLGGTIITHLFGGSAGREGTAIQMGGSLAARVGRLLRLDAADTRIILMCGISGGFGSVFGTPLAGTVFALEVLVIGMLRYEALLPCFIASVVGNLVTTAWGIQHVHFQIDVVPDLSLIIILKVLAASIAFGLTALLFSTLTHYFKRTFTKLISHPAARSFVGGTVIILLVFIFGTRDYLGLGIPLIERAFSGDVPDYAFLLKILFTALTLGAGFLGGEVTPLFVIGAALGSSLGIWFNEPVGFFAALGFIAVFSGAANTPLACFIMGIELFGAEAGVYMLMACVIGYLFSGHTGIYSSQQLGASKSKLFLIRAGDTLGDIKKK